MGAYWGYRLARRVSSRLPLPAAYGCAERISDLMFRRSSTAREAVCSNLTALLGPRSDQHLTVAREVFRNFARYLVELFRISGAEAPSVAVDGGDHLAAARQAGRGVIVLTAHLGNWELGAALLRRQGAAISAVALPHGDWRMDRLFNEQRRRCGIEVIAMGHQATRMSLQRLREGHLLGALGDRDFAGDGLVLPIGRGRMMFPRGPALLSLRSRAPIVPMIFVREGPWAFRLRCEAPLWPEISGRVDASMERLVAAYAAQVGAWILQCPQQWLMFQPVVQG